MSPILAIFPLLGVQAQEAPPAWMEWEGVRALYERVKVEVAEHAVTWVPDEGTRRPRVAAEKLRLVAESGRIGKAWITVRRMKTPAEAEGLADDVRKLAPIVRERIGDARKALPSLPLESGPGLQTSVDIIESSLAVLRMERDRHSRLAVRGRTAMLLGGPTFGAYDWRRMAEWISREGADDREDFRRVWGTVAEPLSAMRVPLAKVVPAHQGLHPFRDLTPAERDRIVREYWPPVVEFAARYHDEYVRHFTGLADGLAAP